MTFHTTIVNQAVQILNYLERKTSSIHSNSDLPLIINRLMRGATLDDCIRVIDKKYLEWNPNPDLRRHLKVPVLFGRTNFERYINKTTRSI